MITAKQLYVLLCFYHEQDVDDLKSMDFLIDKALIDSDGNVTDLGRKVVLYATKKAEEVM